MATVADLRASQQRSSAENCAREIRRGKDPRRGGQPGQVEIPRQYEPRAAHAAQRHHRLFRDHGVRHVRPARRRQIQRILQRHPQQRAISARRHQRHPRHVEDRGRPHPPRFRGGRARSRCSPTRMRVVAARAQDKQLTLSRRDRARSALARRPARAQADRAQSAVERGQVHAGRRPRHGARRAPPATASCSRIADTGIGIAQRRAAEARPAVRAGREPAHQEPSGLGPRPRDRQVAGRAARRRHAHPLDARQRHARGGAAAARCRNARCRKEEAA